MFCAGHPDIFPADDMALQEAVRTAFGMQERPGRKQLHLIAEDWAPWRSIASLLFWSYYATLCGGRPVIPV
jgi:DNA-3-methyladenine glycosylase II